MSTSAYRTAVQFSKSPIKIDIKKLSTAVSVLKLQPQLRAVNLRSLLNNCVPEGFLLDHKFLKSFRTRVALYHAKNPDTLTLSDANARILTSNGNVTVDEMSVLNDDKLRLNYQAMDEQILHNNSNSWKAISYLEKLKLQMTGFDFKIHYNKDDLPDAIVYMTHGMRRNLIRFGDVLFLDYQKRQFNKLGWPYIGPAIMTNNHTIGVTSEAVVLTESIEMYAWILKAQSVIEHRWNPSKVIMIFADGLITPKLLQILGIEKSCILH